MSETYKKTQAVVNATPTTIYSPPANPPNTVAIFKSVLIANVSGAQTVVQLWQGGSANANLILPPTTLQAGEYGTGTGALTVAQGDSLIAQCSQTAGVTITLEGVEVA